MALSPLLPLPKERLTLSVTCAFEFKRAEHLPEGGVIHRGDMDTTPLANAPGNMPPESLQRRINLLCGDVVPQVALMTAGLYSLSGRGKNR
ncbi:hypothetical protein XC74_13355 [Klebsiella pneumoniae]|nr:hypothetical protein [Klebsiella pneumoniae]